MKNFTVLLFGLSMIAGSANATVFHCTENEAFQKQQGGTADKKEDLKLTIDSSAEIKIEDWFKPAKLKTVIAKRDTRFNSKNSIRFIDDVVNMAGSDSGTTGIFIAKSMIDGKAGTMTLTFNQANDGDGGPQYLWGTQDKFDCTPVRK